MLKNQFQNLMYFKKFLIISKVKLHGKDLKAMINFMANMKIIKVFSFNHKCK
jgi:hypothetical protein